MSTIVSLGFNFPGGEVEEIPFSSRRSLLDADVVLIAPDISSFITTSMSRDGKPRLTSEESFSLQDSLHHWRQEVGAALRAGKNVVVYLTALTRVIVEAGQRQEPAGRSVRTIHTIAEVTNYDWLPLAIGGITNANGSGVKLTQRAAFLKTYWEEFEQLSSYEVYLAGATAEPIIHTRSGERVIGAVAQIAGAEGRLVLIPPVHYDYEEFTREGPDDEPEWTSSAKKFGKRLASALRAVDKALRSSRESTPQPVWSEGDEYELRRESELRGEIVAAERKIADLSDVVATLRAQLSAEGVLRGLLYENGKALEAAILEALRILGFSASQYKKGGSEFDAVFESSEGRFLGEAEGKDAKAIHIDKLRQLEMNIQEDFARDEIVTPAKGVLFGNAYRLQSPGKRPEFFTEKCFTQAKRNGCALVRTTDLFFAARRAKESGDGEFARACRLAIFNCAGEIVRFPEVASP